MPAPDVEPEDGVYKLFKNSEFETLVIVPLFNKALGESFETARVSYMLSAIETLSPSFTVCGLSILILSA